MDAQVFKRCKKCDQLKPIGEFGLDRRKSDGRCYICKACARAHNKAYYRANSERVIVRQSVYAQANRERIKKYQSDWRKDNEVLREKKAAYQQANCEIIREKQKIYRDANRKRIAEGEFKRKGTLNGRATVLFANARRRAQKSGMTFTVAFEDVLRLLATGRCQQSGILFDLQPSAKTHFNPFGPSIDRVDSARGYEPENIQLVCDMFNRGKGEASELDFLAMCVAVAKKHQNNPAVIVRLMELGAL